IAPAGLMAWPRVPWKGPVPAPGTSNVVKHVFRSLAFAERPSPSVTRVRQTASAKGKRPIDFLKYRVVIFFAFIFVEIGLCSLLTKGKNPNRFRKNGFAALNR